ncbi:Crtp, partial [Drosophila busckii]
MAKPAHVGYLQHRVGCKPLVISKKRFQDVVDHSRQQLKLDQREEVEEEQRYLQYLKDGHEALYKCFVVKATRSIDEERQLRFEQELKEAAIRNRQVALEDEQMRKERIMRANKLLNNMKPGPRALHCALYVSDTAYQAKYNEQVNRRIAEETQAQERRDEQLCPESLIPPGLQSEQQIKDKAAAQSALLKEEWRKSLEEREQRRLEQREQDTVEIQIERAQYKCLQEQEQLKAKLLKQKKREFCRRAYQEALKEKAEIAAYNRNCEAIEDRLHCVSATAQRRLSKRYNQQVKDMRAELIRKRDAHIDSIAVKHAAAEREAAASEQQLEDKYAFEVEVDEARRKCELQELAKQRRAYELEDKQQALLKAQHAAQLQRFAIAERFKNAEINKRFNSIQRRKLAQEKDELKSVLLGQREEFLQQRRDELMRMGACQEDPNLAEDVYFFDEVVKQMRKCRKTGRPLFPLAKAAELYKRQNDLDMVPEGRGVKRSRLRDYCWPGFHDKADLAYRKYEHKEQCRQEQEKERHELFNNCIKITKMAAEELPYKECIAQGAIKCMQHRGIPAMEDISEFDCASVCYDEAPPIKLCPANMQVTQAAKPLQQQQPAKTFVVQHPEVVTAMQQAKQHIEQLPKPAAQSSKHSDLATNRAKGG